MRSARPPALPISIHALREEGDVDLVVVNVVRVISIHALREEGDRWIWRFISASSISIHALREEGAPHSNGPIKETVNFYPRPPRGGRRGGAAMIPFPDKFLSTPSARRATLAPGAAIMARLFLSTPSARRATLSGSSSPWSTVFLSTPSARRATAKTETKSLFSYKLYNILHEFRRALIYNGSKNYPNHAK